MTRSIMNMSNLKPKSIETSLPLLSKTTRWLYRNRFSIFAALCEEKCKVLRELVEDVVF
jgi:hypothetical protein